jgi:hypothetical protein
MTSKASWALVFWGLLATSCGESEAIEIQAKLVQTPTVADPADAEPDMQLQEVLGEQVTARLQDWPNVGSRFRLQLAAKGSMTFQRGIVQVGPAPNEVDALIFGSDWLIVRVGPVGEWYANQSLYIVFHRYNHEVLAAGHYLYSDMGGGGWGTIHGQVTTEPGLECEEEPLRCSYSFSTDGPGEDPDLMGSFELPMRVDSESLAHDLKKFGVLFAE